MGKKGAAPAPPPEPSMFQDSTKENLLGVFDDLSVKLQKKVRADTINSFNGTLADIFNNVNKMKVFERSSIIRSTEDRVKFVKDYLDSVNYFKKAYQARAAQAADAAAGSEPIQPNTESKPGQMSSPMSSQYTMSTFIRDLENVLPGIEPAQVNEIRNGNIDNVDPEYLIAMEHLIENLKNKPDPTSPAEVLKTERSNRLNQLPRVEHLTDEAKLQKIRAALSSLKRDEFNFQGQQQSNVNISPTPNNTNTSVNTATSPINFANSPDSSMSMPPLANTGSYTSAIGGVMQQGQFDDVKNVQLNSTNLSDTTKLQKIHDDIFTGNTVTSAYHSLKEGCCDIPSDFYPDNSVSITAIKKLNDACRTSNCGLVDLFKKLSDREGINVDSLMNSRLMFPALRIDEARALVKGETIAFNGFKIWLSQFMDKDWMEMAEDLSIRIQRFLNLAEKDQIFIFQLTQRQRHIIKKVKVKYGQDHISHLYHRFANQTMNDVMTTPELHHAFVGDKLDIFYEDLAAFMKYFDTYYGGPHRFSFVKMMGFFIANADLLDLNFDSVIN